MAFDERLADRIRAAFPPEVPYTEKKMFGGLSFLVDGKMCCGILKNELIVKVGAEAHEAALAQPHTRVMDFTGRPMRGFVQVTQPGIRTQPMLVAWIKRGLACPPPATTAKKKRIR